MRDARRRSFLRPRMIGHCALVALPTLCGLACAARQPTDRVPQAVQSFVADVREEEWQAAVPAKESTIALPRLIRGKKQLRSQVYEPPSLNGSPVAIRGEVSVQATRSR
jgi:hypothetical protein